MLILLIHSDVSPCWAFLGLPSELLPVGTLCFEVSQPGSQAGDQLMDHTHTRAQISGLPCSWLCWAAGGLSESLSLKGSESGVRGRVSSLLPVPGKPDAAVGLQGLSSTQPPDSPVPQHPKAHTLNQVPSLFWKVPLFL